ncbi:hypothetical protein [Novosphingobium sp. BL-52-GroH]|uniref:hypothetical protein n=1 Tax=Novosphingobium sp. BL-52-GroH TaxID=3349877 RepID=UPI00384C4AF0
MATAGKSGAGDKQGTAHPGAYPTRQPSRWKRNLTVLALLAIAGWLAWAWQGLREEALVGAAYGARVGCVCRFVSQRPLKACEGDLKIAGLSGIAARVSLSEDTERQAITGSVPLLARQSADFREDRGCQLKPWQD